MQFQEARELIRCNELTAARQPVQWADLGCGQGLFSYALASWLPAGSAVFAIDKDNSFSPSPAVSGDVAVLFKQMDFTAGLTDLPLLDGILMANSLHYVRDKTAFLEEMLRYCKEAPYFLIVEYDITQPVPRWVPYPVDFASLITLFTEAGFALVRKLGERPSRYGRGNIYSAFIQKEQKS